jgi:CheY-like chemotaxis protein
MVVAEKRILVVDDEQIVRDSCQRALTEAGYAVRTVGNGRDALQACRDEPVDVMLTDLRMPDMDGLEVIRAVAKEFPEVRVVVITGYPSRESAEEAARLGIFDYIEKPLTPKGLDAATAAALARPRRPEVTASPTAAPGSDVAVPAEGDPEENEQAELEGMPAPKGRSSTQNRIRQAVLASLGFLVGVTAAYIIAPNHALAWLAFGTAVTSGTIFGLFSDAFFAKSA